MSRVHFQEKPPITVHLKNGKKYQGEQISHNLFAVCPDTKSKKVSIFMLVHRKDVEALEMHSELSDLEKYFKTPPISKLSWEYVLYRALWKMVLAYDVGQRARPSSAIGFARAVLADYKRALKIRADK